MRRLCCRAEKANGSCRGMGWRRSVRARPQAVQAAGAIAAVHGARGATASQLSEAVNVSAGVRLRGSYHIQTVTYRDQQFNAFLQPFRGSRRRTWTGACAGFSKVVGGDNYFGRRDY